MKIRAKLNGVLLVLVAGFVIALADSTKALIRTSRSFADAVTDWQPTSAQLAGTEQGIQTIVGSKQIADAERKGLESIIIKMTQENRLTGELFSTLLTTRSRLLNADFGARTFMTKDLSSLEAALGKLVSDLTHTSRLISAATFTD